MGKMEPGERNSISDVAGVTVGHVTINKGGVQTGVTAILPHQGNIFQDKLVAATHILNGFGKTVGTIQINELGTIETPIILTNTLSVGTATEGLIDYMIEQNSEIGATTGTVNPVVGECNDMKLNDIRGRHIQTKHVKEAIQQASADFDEGAVGAGRGMVCYSLKGGIGSASRKIPLHHGLYTLGVLTLTNFGQLEDLTINNRLLGRELTEKMNTVPNEKDQGSVIVILATDLPVSERQLKRIIQRSVIGLAKTGAQIANGSGDIMIGFSTATKIPHQPNGRLLTIPTIHEEEIDLAFRAASEATEEAVLSSLISVSHDEAYKKQSSEVMTLLQCLTKFDVRLS
ncbi:D-aminopeptidase [Alkalihalobacillus pseudalcaliphilus]|nr:D-aminopeptidase [Alkalihalobacillus pseudalcaliphilus]